MADGFPCDRFLSMFRGAKQAHSAVLWDTFGNNMSCLRRFLKLSAKMPVSLEIHPTCGPCRRSPNWPKQPKAGSNFERIRRFIERNRGEGRTFLVSLELEDQFRDKEAANVNDGLQARIDVLTVRNSIFSVRGHDTDFVELHGKKARCRSASQLADLDGDDLSWPDVRRWLRANKNCAYRRVWKARWQGIPDSKFRALADRNYNISRLDVREVRRFLKGK